MQCGVKQLYLAGHCWCRLQTLPPCLSAPASRLPPLAPLSHPPAQTTSHFTQISSCTITLHFTQTSYCTNNITFHTDFLLHKQHHISHKLPPAQTTSHFTQTSSCTNNITFHTNFLLHKQHHISHKLPPAQTHHISHAAVVCAVLESISGLEPSSVIAEPKYLKPVTVSSLCPFTLVSVFSFTHSYHFQWPWPHFKVAAVSDSW